jgi:deoxyribodipyrimidine photolyase-related protein
VPEPRWPREDDVDAAVRADLDAMDLPTTGVDGRHWRAAATTGGRTTSSG